MNELKTYAKAGQIVQEVFSSLRTVLSLNGTNFEQNRYEKELLPTSRSNIFQGAVFGIYTGWLSLITYLAYTVGFIFGSLLMSNTGYHGLNISDILVGNDPTINESDVWKETAQSIYNINGHIEFDNVNFFYPSRKDVQVLNNLSLIARAGQTTAIVGASGCGKSTYISLLLRYYELSSGRITIDGRSITDYNIQQLRQNIGVVSQEPILFGMSIYDNIRFGKVNATREEIEEAAKTANAHNFIMKLPNKYETFVGERGIQLSGGEKQRIVLARALVKQPTFLLLDEATSALDNANEKIVQDALDRACKGDICFVLSIQLYTAFAISGSKLTQRIRSKAFSCLLRQEVAYLDLPENSSGAICARLSSDASAIQELTGKRLGFIGEAIALTIFGIIFGYIINWQLTLIVLGPVFILFILFYFDVILHLWSNRRSIQDIGKANTVNLGFT
ncbi:unnamed protein product [Rotaria sp. Silwood2]|nr:unnamed protein product [Rotaria sp. Silwood2]CAF4068794.1 unnamed protein product [Rotaria sp. Silwood2]